MPHGVSAEVVGVETAAAEPIWQINKILKLVSQGVRRWLMAQMKAMTNGTSKVPRNKAKSAKTLH